MATKLKNMKLTSVDLVKAGANQKADICLHKSADPQDDIEFEKNIFKRFLDWLYEKTASNEALEGMKEDTVEKSDDSETAEIYKSAINESIQSIVDDDSLSAEEKKNMIEKSLEQYHEKMVELAKATPQTEEQIPDTEDEPDEEPDGEPEEEPESTPEYEDIEEVENPVKKK